MEQQKSLATGHELTRETWADFVERLRHDCVGEGVRDHCTADAIFIVEAKRRIYGIDDDYTDKLVVFCDEREWLSPEEYWADSHSSQKAKLNRMMQEWAGCQFMKAGKSDQWHVLDLLDDHTVTGYEEQWEYVCAHFTNDAAEAFIQRKKHDYRLGMRVYVNAQVYCWEFNQIKEAILSGRLTLTT